MHALLASAYVWTQIVIPGATMMQAFGLNDKGQTAINTSDGRSGIYGGGTFTPLPAPPPGFQVSALGINDAGVITGGATTTTNPNEQGFILVGSSYRFFSRPGWDVTEPRAIANSGLITGQNFGSAGQAGFIYNPATNTFTDATPPNSTRTITQGMNAAGRITGDGRQPGLNRYAFVWQQDTITKGKRELLPFLDRIRIDGAGSAARGINDSGVIVGFTNSGKGFVGTDARGYQVLTAPGGDPAVGFSTLCEGINNDAQVVCGVSDANGDTVGEFIGTPREGENDEH